MVMNGNSGRFHRMSWSTSVPETAKTLVLLYWPGRTGLRR
jgi:hypothetical protein